MGNLEGGAPLPDKYSRYKKVIKFGIHQFIQQDLDLMVSHQMLMAEAHFNKLERKIARLSRELSGLILPHDDYGSHLDERAKTMGTELEEKNFDFAGKTVDEIFSQLIVDSYPADAEYNEPAKSELTERMLMSREQNWWDVHVRSNQYLTQVVKCGDERCCLKQRVHISV